LAKPQRENGHIDIANDIAEQLAKVNLSPYESRLMWAVLRKTWGYVQRDKNGKTIKNNHGWPLKKKFDWVSVSQLQELTGLDRRNVSRMKLRLLRRKLLIKNGNKLGFNRDYDQWLSLKQTTDNIVYRDTRPKWFPPPGYAYKYSDGGLCEYCLKEFRFNKDELEKHHIIPISMGGKDIKENQIWLCIPCHKKIENEFKELNIVDLDDIPKIQRYYRRFVSSVSVKQTTFLSSKLTNTKEKRNVTKESKPSCRNFQICDELRGKMEALILRNKPDYRFRGGKDREGKWTDGFRLIIEQDKRKPDRIAEVMEWALNNPFWRANILSPHKLRIQFDALELRMKSEQEEGGYGTSREPSKRGGRKDWKESEKYRGLYS